MRGVSSNQSSMICLVSPETSVPQDHPIRDRAYDTRDFVDDCRERGVTPHVAQNDTRRRSAIDQRTTRHVGYSISQRLRMRIEQVFGWGKTIGGLKRTRVRGLARTRFGTYLVGTAYNLLRITNLRRQLAE